MSDDPARELIDELAAGLEPVRPIAPIGRRLALPALVAVPVALAAFAVYGLPPRGGLPAALPFDGVLLGLALAALGACTSALASVVPGRETLQRASAALAGLGLALAVGVAAVGMPWGGAVGSGSLHPILVCIGRGALFATLPISVLLLLVVRGWAGRPAWTGIAAAVGGGATGAGIVQLICPATNAVHVLCAHAATPFLLAALVGTLLVPIVRRWAR